MDVFEKIDEFEKKISSNILKRVNLFRSIIQDVDEFLKNPDYIKEYKSDKNFKEILSEMLDNRRFKKMLLERHKNNKDSRKNSQCKTASYSLNMKEINKEKEKSVVYNQNSYKTIPHFFIKKNEIEIVSNLSCEIFVNSIKKNIFSINNKIKNSNWKRLKLSKTKRSKSSSSSICVNENDSKSLDQSQKVNSSKNLNSPFSKLSLEKDKLSGILTPEFLKKSIKQMKIDEVVRRDTNLGETIKHNHFKEKFKNYEFNFRNTVKETDNITQTSLLNAGFFNIKKLSSNKNKEFIKTARCNNKFFSQKIIEVRNTVNDNDNIKMNDHNIIRRSSTKNKEILENNKIILDTKKISNKQEFVLKKEKDKFFIVQNRVLSSKIKIKK